MWYRDAPADGRAMVLTLNIHPRFLASTILIMLARQWYNNLC